MTLGSGINGEVYTHLLFSPKVGRRSQHGIIMTRTEAEGKSGGLTWVLTHVGAFLYTQRLSLTGVLPSDRVIMLMDVLILSEEEEREGGEGLLFSTSCLWRKSRQARWMLQTCSNDA